MIFFLFFWTLLIFNYRGYCSFNHDTSFVNFCSASKLRNPWFNMQWYWRRMFDVPIEFQWDVNCQKLGKHEWVIGKLDHFFWYFPFATRRVEARKISMWPRLNVIVNVKSERVINSNKRMNVLHSFVCIYALVKKVFIICRIYKHTKMVWCTRSESQRQLSTSGCIQVGKEVAVYPSVTNHDKFSLLSRETIALQRQVSSSLAIPYANHKSTEKFHFHIYLQVANFVFDVPRSSFAWLSATSFLLLR